MRLLVIAWRNLWRNQRRTFLTASSIFLGVGFVVFLDGFFNGFIRAVIASSVGTHIAAIQVHAAGFADARNSPLEKNLPDDLASAIGRVPGVVAAAPRLAFQGLVNNGTRAAVFSALGVDPANEDRVCPRRAASMHEKSFSSVSDVFLGRELALSLDAHAGTTLSLLTTTRSGKQNALDVDFAGDLDFHEPFVGKRAVLTTLRFAQALLGMPGRASEYAVSVDELTHATDIARVLRQTLGPGFRVDTWRERDEGIAVFVDRTSVVFYAVSLVFLALVLSGIANTMLMSMHERVREIGTMLAIGMRRRQVLALVLLEAMALAACSAVAGALLGAGIVARMHQVGLALRPPGQLPVLVYPFVSFADIASVVMLAVLGSLLAALYPAYRTSRLRPVEALAGGD